MSEPNMITSNVLTITRIFDAPVELVWRAWIEPGHMMRWWGPQGFSSPICRLDLRVGGSYLFCMRSPDGHDYYSAGVFRVIEPLKKLVYTDSFADEHGNVVPASHYGFPIDFPSEQLVTVTFEDIGDKTKMTLKQAGLPAGEHGELAELGWSQSFDKLAESLR